MYFLFTVFWGRENSNIFKAFYEVCNSTLQIFWRENSNSTFNFYCHHFWRENSFFYRFFYQNQHFVWKLIVFFKKHENSYAI